MIKAKCFITLLGEPTLPRTVTSTVDRVESVDELLLDQCVRRNMNAMGTGAKLTFVVVPVTIGVVAFPINTPVFFIAQVKAERKEVQQRLVSKPAQCLFVFHINSTLVCV